jgi:hypothetical protein
MVRKAIVKDLCDQCLDDTSQDLETDADYCMVISLNEGGYIAVDLCTMHADALSVFEMIKMARDVRPDKTERGKHIREKVECIHCGKWYSSGSGIALHIKAAHKLERDNHKVIITN